VRAQNVLQTAVLVAKEEGITALYKGEMTMIRPWDPGRGVMPLTDARVPLRSRRGADGHEAGDQPGGELHLLPALQDQVDGAHGYAPRPPPPPLSAPC
jgi:hypothetical protein